MKSYSIERRYSIFNSGRQKWQTNRGSAIIWKWKIKSSSSIKTSSSPICKRSRSWQKNAFISKKRTWSRPGRSTMRNKRIRSLKDKRRSKETCVNWSSRKRKSSRSSKITMFKSKSANSRKSKRFSWSASWTWSWQRSARIYRTRSKRWIDLRTNSCKRLSLSKLSTVRHPPSERKARKFPKRRPLKCMVMTTTGPLLKGKDGEDDKIGGVDC